MTQVQISIFPEFTSKCIREPAPRLIQGGSRARIWTRGSVPIVHMPTRKPGVRATIKELKGNVPTDITQQIVVAHSERILGTESVGIPSIDGHQGARIRSN